MTQVRQCRARHREDGRTVRLLGPALLLGSLTLAGGTTTTAGTFSASTFTGQTPSRSTAMIAPHKGILPPKNPSKSLPPKPDFLSSSSCSSAKDTTACNDLVLSATSNARNLLEKLGPMSFSLSAYEKLTGAEQLFVTANVERVGRGLAPMLELTNSLDSLAQAVAKANTDPDIDRIIKTKLPGGGRVISAGANFASGYHNPLGSNYGWMYDDGLGSPNRACTSKNPQACWGHRDNILADSFNMPCGTTSCHLIMGAGYLKGGAGAGYSSYTELFIQVGRVVPSLYYSWKQAVAAGAKT